MVRNLTHYEWKYAWRWSPRDYKVQLGDNVAYLYNEDGKLISSYPYILKMDQLNMKVFALQAIQAMTRLPYEKVKEKYEKVYETKQKLWEIYRIPVDVPKRLTSRWITVRKRAYFTATPQPNQLGFYYAEIGTRFNNHLKFINDNVFELLCDLFFVLECYIGHEEIPFTFSQAWYMDYRVYGDRRFSESIARYNIKQSYMNYIIDRLADTLYRKKGEPKATYMHILDLIRKMGSENKYYIMDTILHDPHFELNEDDFVVYYPLPIVKDVLEGGKENDKEINVPEARAKMG